MWKRQLHDNLNFLEISAKSIPSTLPSSLVSRSIAISQGESEGSDFYQPWRRGIRVEAGVGPVVCIHADGINAVPSLAAGAKARVSLIIGRRAALLSRPVSRGFKLPRSFQWAVEREGGRRNECTSESVRSDDLFSIFDSSN